MITQELNKQMKSNILVDYTPINFYKSLLGVFIKVFIVFLVGWLVFYTISDNIKKEYVKSHILLAGLLFIILITIALLQTWFNSKIYIYQIISVEDKLTFKWQELKLFKEMSVPIKDVVVKMKPSGKNTPYLEINLQTLILKQTYYPGWNKETMTNFIDKINELKTTE